MDAPEEEIIDAVRVAGLANQKGPRIKAVLQQIKVEVGSLDLSFLTDLPLEEARDWLLRFKGVGRQWPAGNSTRGYERGKSPPVDGAIGRAGGLLRWAPKPDPPGARNLPPAQARLPELPGAGVLPLFR